MAINTDNFTYIDGNLETVSVLGGAWVRYDTAGTLNIVSNKVQNAPGSTVNSVYVYGATYTGENVYSQWLFDTLGAGWEMGGVINIQDPGTNTYDGYVAACYDNGGGSTRFELYKATNRTTNVQLGSSGTTTIVVNDVGKITHEASDVIKGYVNGSALSGVSGTDSTYSAATSGIYMNSTAGGAWRLDNWEGGDLAAGGAFIARSPFTVQRVARIRAAVY